MVHIIERPSRSRDQRRHTMIETEMREFLSMYFTAAMPGHDPGVYADLFTPDGILEDPVGTPPQQGREAIRQFVASGHAMVERFDVTVQDVFVCGSETAVRWTGHVYTKRGAHLVIEAIGIFVFDAQHKLRRVREYYDVAQLLAIFSKEG
jgi:steroid delta-isomerase